MKIAVLPGDGIGPEVMSEAVSVLERVAERRGIELVCTEALMGGAAIDATGVPLPDDTLELAKASDAVLLGAVGGPKWDHLTGETRPERGLLGLRKALATYANMRPVRVYPALAEHSPLRPELTKDCSLLIVRELTGGLYFGEPRGVETIDGARKGVDSLVYWDWEIERIARVAFEAARGRRKLLHSVDKANVLKSSGLWRQVVTEVASDYPDVELQHMLVDNCAMQIVRNPGQFDVIVTGNMFGDILSDESSMLGGSLGLLPSASVGAEIGLFEPVHGSAPDIAGRGLANPVAAVLSVAMMLDHSFGMAAEARAIEAAVNRTLDDGLRTADISTGTGKASSTAEVGERIRAHLDTELSEGAKG